MLRFVIIAIIFIILVILFVRLFERQMVFFPSKYPAGFRQLQNSRLDLKDVWFAAADGAKLHGWLMPHTQPQVALLMCHGNAGNVSDRYEWLEMLHEQVPANLFIFDYRGFGRSEGTPTEEGCYLDAVAAFNWLAAQKPELPIIVHGHSLGSAVAVELAHRLSERAPAGLILESGFTNAVDMGKLMFGPIPLYWLTSMKWASDEKIGTITIPKLFLHGEHDSIIPLRLGQKLFAAAAPPKEFVVLPRADHNDTFVAGGEEYYQTIRKFVEQCTRMVKLL
ncbi:MAG: alpha/beta hydrolase [bacterium]